MATCNASGQGPSGWAVGDMINELVKWLATLHFGPYCTRQMVEEAWSNQSAGHVKPLQIYYHPNPILEIVLEANK